uniref:Reverse transcriptase domain-containing protein n=1 Tax=Cannabis sativa TaxID=3483 RepID=A0A803PJ47_CANSA
MNLPDGSQWLRKPKVVSSSSLMNSGAGWKAQGLTPKFPNLEDPINGIGGGNQGTLLHENDSAIMTKGKNIAHDLEPYSNVAASGQKAGEGLIDEVADLGQKSITPNNEECVIIDSKRRRVGVNEDGTISSEDELVILIMLHLNPVSTEEVKATLFDMNPDKSPGPDGMTPAFYQKSWAIVVADVVANVQNFFASGEMLPGFNDTNLVLIPKKKNSIVMGHLRPIALCYVLYKIVSKVLANRLKGLLDQIISPFQSTFIPSRLILDNILVSFEVLHYLKRKSQGKKGYMALKLDMSNAYDRVEWPFLETILLKMGFHQRWINLIMACVRSVQYHIVHDGQRLGPVLATRGIRQGDPLSPYLFILCAEGFSALILRYETNRWIHGCKIARSAPTISHMFFADDSYLYCQASEVEALYIIEQLRKFELASGQKVNVAKSSIFFSANIDDGMRDRIMRITGMVQVDENSTYLGLPSTMGRNKSAVLGFLKDRVRKRVESWDAKMLSRAGKEILIKTVTQALPSYAMSVFLLPLKVCRELERILCSCWWRSSPIHGKGISWESWDRMVVHKHSGGMGFRSLHDHNIAMLGKQGWRLLTYESSLVRRIFKARYYPLGSFLDASIGNNPSYVWRSIFESQSLIKSGARWSIANGSLVDVLNQPWLMDKDNLYITSSHPTLLHAKVSQLMAPNERRWDEDIINDLFSDVDRELVKGVVISSSREFDNRYWFFEASGQYSVKSAYKRLQVVNGRWIGGDNSGLWRKLWNLKIPAKISVFLWRACRNNRPTRINLLVRHVDVPSVCPFCHLHDETVEHVIVDCSVAVIGWAIWKARNELVRNNKQPVASTVVQSALAYFDQWKSVKSQSFESDMPAGVVSSPRWVPPLLNTIKVNIDASIFASENRFGFGWLARDHEGRVLFASAVAHQVAVEPVMAEAIGLKEVLSWLKTNDYPQVVVESDCQVLINAIQNKVTMYYPFGLIVVDCVSLLNVLRSVTLNFVRRSANKAANFLARNAGSYAGRSYSGGLVPTDLQAIIVADLQ